MKGLAPAEAAEDRTEDSAAAGFGTGRGCAARVAAGDVVHRHRAGDDRQQFLDFTLLRELKALTQLGYPLMAGYSRKSSLGTVTGRPVNERLAASLAAALIAAQNGAAILRVHDVRETVDVLKVLSAAR